ncbi:hypothetical protein, partial [Xanthomonas campestris]|uniref:hypothetical protein n=1 Tax=Xanthomonas campestris TaxID=339 RepID=UPI0032E3DB9D
HARTFFQAITSQVIDLPGGNVGKPQSQNWVQAAAERAHGEQQRQIQQEQSQPHPARALT